MFDFPRWRDWLVEQAGALNRDDLTTRFAFNDQHLRGAGLEIAGSLRVASFRVWENGLVDYEIMDTKSNAHIANEAMVVVDDSNFPSVFRRFVNSFNSAFKTDH